MLRSGLIVLVVTAVGFVAGGCQNKLHDENVALYRQNRELQSDNSKLKQDVNSRPDPATVTQLQAELNARDAQIADLQKQLQAPAPGQPRDTGLAGIEVTRDDVAGTVTVNLPGDVLFDSGQAEVKASAKSTLNKVVAAIKKDYSGKMVYVDGYTDSDPISRTKDKYEDNLDLSAVRARTVAKYLVGEGIAGRSVIPRGMNSSKPKATKAASRRVEIVVATR